MKNKTNIVETITEIGLFAALGFVLDELQGIIAKGIFVNGGSIGFAMITIVIISFRRGIIPGFLTGIIIGLFDMATGSFIIHPAQPLLDYILPYALVSISALFTQNYRKNTNKNIWIIIAVTVGGLLKLLSHYLSGVLFWGNSNNFAWNLSYLSAPVYSLIYNFAFIGPSIVISIIILIFINKSSKKILNPEIKFYENDNTETASKQNLIWPITITTLGAASFIYFLIRYIKSFETLTNPDGSIEYAFNSDCMVMFLTGLSLTIIGVCYFLFALKKKAKIKSVCYSLIIVDICSLIYSLSRLIRVYQKSLQNYIYWIWFSSCIILLVFLVFIILKNKQKKN